MGKMRQSRGFTLVETMVSLAILVMLISVISVGVSTAMKAYQSVTFISESDLLSSTVQTALADILRYAVYNEEDNPPNGEVSITNESYGISRGGFFLENGRLMVNLGGGGGIGGDGSASGNGSAGGNGASGGDTADTFFLVNDGAYTSMKMTDFEITYEEGLFSGKYVIESNSGKFKKTKEFAFRTLKAK